jgi:hypothetical protein
MFRVLLASDCAWLRIAFDACFHRLFLQVCVVRLSDSQQGAMVGYIGFGQGGDELVIMSMGLLLYDSISFPTSAES